MLTEMRIESLMAAKEKAEVCAEACEESGKDDLASLYRDEVEEYNEELERRYEERIEQDVDDGREMKEVKQFPKLSEMA